MNRAVFLDRDGVLNETVFRMGKPRAPYTMEEFRLCSRVPEALESLKAKGFLLIVVTNQPDVARGWVDLKAVEAVNERLLRELPLDDLKACFHTEKDACNCRKPRPGMLLEAQREWNIDLSGSFMVGDRYSDVEAGRAANCRTILIGPGDDPPVRAVPDHRAASLFEAVEWILSEVDT